MKKTNKKHKKSLKEIIKEIWPILLLLLSIYTLAIIMDPNLYN